MAPSSIKSASVCSLAVEAEEMSPEDKAKAETQAKEICEALKNSTWLTMNDINTGRSRFGVMKQAHEIKGLSPVPAAGLAAVKCLVPITVAGFFRRKSIQESQLLENQKLREQDWAKNATSPSKELSRDPYDTSDAALETAIEQEIKRAEALQKQKNAEMSQEEQEEGNKVIA